MALNDLFDYLDDQERIQKQSGLVAGAMLNAHGTNPDQFARMKKLEKETGRPATWLVDNPAMAEEAQRQVDLSGDKWELLSTHAPKTSAWLADGDNARVAHDDIENMSGLEKALDVTSKAFRSLAASPWSVSQGLWAVPRVAGDLLQNVTKPISDTTGLPDFGGNLAAWSSYFQRGTEATRNKIKGNQDGAGLLERGLYSGMESLGQNLLTLPLTIMSGGSTAPMLTSMSLTTGGQEYGKARDKGKGVASSINYGVSQGLIEYATERIPAIKFVQGLQLKTSLGKFAKDFIGSEVIGEEIATVTQDLNEWAVLNPDKPFSDYLKERPSAFAETLIATIVGSGGQVVIAKGLEKAGYSVDKYLAAQHNRNMMLALGESATASKLRARLPEKYRELVAKIKEGGDVDNVYIPAEDWKTYWQEQKQDPAQVAESTVEGGDSQYAEALASGGDVVIPLEVYAERLAASEHHQGLIDSLKLHAGDMTGKEAAEFEKNKEEITAEILDQLQAEALTAETNRPSYLKVYDDLFGQLQRVFPRDTAERYATLGAVRARSRAERLGVDAFALYNESPLKISRPLPESLQRKTVDTGIDPLLDRLRVADVPTDESIFGSSLLQFLRETGIQDQGGELAAMDAAKGRKGLVRANGVPLDRARELATEAGYLPEGSTVRDLLDKIDGELRGTPTYSNKPVDERAFDLRATLDELKGALDERGIDLNQMDNEAVRRSLFQGTGGELWQRGSAEGQEAMSVRASREAGYLVPAILRNGVVKAAGIGATHYDVHTMIPATVPEGVTSIVGFVTPDGKMLDRKESLQWVRDNRPEVFAKLDKTTQKNGLESQAYAHAEGVTTPNESLADDFIKNHFGGGMMFFQGKRGYFRTTPTSREIGILENADLSTFVHELSHSWLEELKQDAERPDAPEQLKKDWETIQKWAGIEGDVSVAAHELFARAGEAYVMEGKAPSAELQGVFQRFKSWLVQIYKTLAGLNVKLNDDVRGVFDRLLASDEEIQAARRMQGMAEMFATAEDAGMTEAEFAAYKKTAEKAHAAEVERLDKKLMAEMSREQKAWWEEARDAMRAVVEEEAESTPVYLAIRLLSTGKMFDGSEGPVMKLDKAALVRMYGEPFLKRLPRGFGYIYANEGGIHPDAAAEMFGFASGDEMIREMIETPPMKQWVKNETDLRMRDTYGDMMTDGSIADEAQSAIHNEYRADVLRAELKAIRRLQRAAAPIVRAQNQQDTTGRREFKDSIPPNEVFELAAAQAIGAKKIGGIDPRLYLAVERRAAKRTLDLVSRKEWAEAAKAKQQELLNHYLYREATKAREQVEDIIQQFDALNKSDEKLAKTRDINMVNAARAILSQFGIGKRGIHAAEYMAQIAQYAPEIYPDLQAAVDAVAQQPKDYKLLTMDEFNAVTDAVMNLWNLSKRSKQVEIDGRLVDKEMVIDELTARIDDIGLPKNRAGYNRAVSKWDKFKAGLVGARAAATRVEAWVEAMDAGKPDGPFRRYVWQPVVEGIDRYRMAKKQYIIKYLDLIKQVEPTLTQDKIDASELGYTFNGKQELFGALLHTGNASNMEKLLVGRNWGYIAEDGGLDTSQWDGFIQRMQDEGKLIKADYDFIQSVWDLFEEIKPLSQKAHHDMYGYYFSEITHQPIQTQWGEYKGGYAPAMADSNIVQDAEMRQERESLENSGNSFMFPSTGRGFTKSRVKYNKPLTLDLKLVPSHLDKVLRFSFIEPRVKDVGRLFWSPHFRETMNTFDPSAVNSMIMPWLQRSARQTVETPSVGRDGRALDTVMRFLRRNTGMQMMVLNVANTLQQFTGLSLSATKVKPSYLTAALFRYAKGPRTMAADVADRSEMMQTRVMQSAFDLQQEAEDILLNPTKYEKLKDFSIKNGYMLQQITQHTVDVITWAGAYDQALSEGADEKDAVRQADSAVRMTQGSFNAEDLSKMETGSPFVRAFTQFYSYFNMQANLLGSQVLATVRESGWQGSTPRLFYLYFFGLAVPAILSEGLMMAARGGDPEDDEMDMLMQLLVTSQVRTVAAMVPGVGQGINYMINLANKKRYDDRISTAPFLTTLEATGRAPYSVYKYMNDEGSLRMAVKDTLTAIGMMTSMPVAALGRPLGYLAGIEEGRYAATDELDFARGLITGYPSK